MLFKGCGARHSTFDVLAHQILPGGFPERPGDDFLLDMFWHDHHAVKVTEHQIPRLDRDLADFNRAAITSIINTGIARPATFISGNSGWTGWGRNWCVKPRTSRISPTTGV